MKKRWLIIPFLTLALILVLILLPVSFISANPENLVLNGDFSLGSTGWQTQNAQFPPGEYAWIYSTDSMWSVVYQDISTSNKNLKFSFSIRPIAYDGNGFIGAGFTLYKNGNTVDPDPDKSYAYHNYHQNLQLNEWYSGSFTIKELWQDYQGTSMPDFDTIGVWVETSSTFVECYVDNIKLEPYSEAEEEEVAWIRDREMGCKNVWVNQDGDFQFSFVYPYADNNWVKIYDMAGNLVYEVDMPYDNPNIIVDLPDGTYTVKTFHVDPATPIQEFVIGKP